MPEPPPPPPPARPPAAEPRHPCPVCLGVKMKKLRLVSGDDLTVDRCERCGGVWFDAGEVARLRALRPVTEWRKIALGDDAYRMPCHSCQALMDRNAERCPACGWKNVLACPTCERPMTRRQVDGWHLDFCVHCRGVWFDRIELAGIWNLQADALEPRRVSAAKLGQTASGAADVAAQILIWNPELAVFGARAAGHVAATAAAHAPEVLGAVVKVTAELAGNVFEVIAEIVGSLFD